MTRSRARTAWVVLVSILLVLHVWPPWVGEDPVWLGFLPWDLTYHLLWMIAALAVVLFMTERVWPDDAEPSP
jgi:hypothetical protein